MDHETLNPLDELQVTRDHIIALKEAYTHTNKVSSSKRLLTLRNTVAAAPLLILSDLLSKICNGFF